MVAIREFGGIRPKISPYLLPMSGATEALNASFRTGKLCPMRRPVTIATTAKTNTGIGVFPDQTRAHFDKPVDAVMSGERMIVTKDDATSHPMFVEQDAPTVTYRLGMPKPTTPTVAFAPNGNDAEAVQSDRSFGHTWINAHGDESDISDLVSLEMGPDDTVDLTIGEIPLGEWDRRATSLPQVYVSGIGTRDMYPIDHDVVNGKLRVDLSSPRGLDTYRFYSGATLPPQGLRNIQAHPNGFWVGIDGNTVRMSETGDIGRWPPEYSYHYPHGELLGHAIHIDQVCVFPVGEPPVILAMSAPFEVQVVYTTVPWACVSRRSIVSTGFGVFYCSASGVVSMNGQEGRLVTEDLFDRHSFEPFNPGSIKAFEFDGVYHCYGNGRPFLLDIHSAGAGFEIARLSINPSDVKSVNGRVTGVENGAVRVYNLEGGRVQYTWESRLFRLPAPITIGAVQIRADYRERTVTDVNAGIGHNAIGEAGIGEPRAKVHSVRRKPAVLFSLIDETGETLFGPAVVQDAGSYPVHIPFKIDTFKMRLASDTDVESCEVAQSQRDVGAG